jgi:hypothetical protein
MPRRLCSMPAASKRAVSGIPRSSDLRIRSISSQSHANTQSASERVSLRASTRCNLKAVGVGCQGAHGLCSMPAASKRVVSGIPRSSDRRIRSISSQCHANTHLAAERVSGASKRCKAVGVGCQGARGLRAARRQPLRTTRADLPLRAIDPPSPPAADATRKPAC